MRPSIRQTILLITAGISAFESQMNGTSKTGGCEGLQTFT